MFASKDRKQQPGKLASASKNRSKTPSDLQKQPLDSLQLLQRSVGNQYLQALSQTVGQPDELFRQQKDERRMLLQPKLVVGAANDIYEQEADRVAEQVMRMPEPKIQRVCPECEEELQRQPMAEEEEEETLQTKTAFGEPPTVSINLQNQITALRGGGQPLPQSERNFFEPRFGTDFSGVRLHTDSTADTLNRTLNARAFTTGQDVFFRQDEYDVGRSRGKELLAHELAHVVQQTTIPLASGIFLQHQPAAPTSPPPLFGPRRFQFLPPPTPPWFSGTPGILPAQPGLPSLEKFTDFTFRWGPFNFQVKLPKSVEVYLPLELQGKNWINFSLKAETSGDFSFNVTLNGLRDVQMSFKGGVSVGEEETKAGGEIIISSKRKVCRFDTVEQIKAEIRTAGEKLTKAINAVQGTSPENPPTTTEAGIATSKSNQERGSIDEKFKRWIDVAKSIGELYDASKKLTDPCTEVPGFSIKLEASTPLGEQKQPTPEELTKPGLGSPLGTYAGIKLVIPF
jgi:hypothetical protein